MKLRDLLKFNYTKKEDKETYLCLLYIYVSFFI